jgi:hypothetical protein
MRERREGENPVFGADNINRFLLILYYIRVLDKAVEYLITFVM